MSPFYTDTVPSLAGKPILTMLTIIALLAGSILALQWLHRIILGFFIAPLPARHPHTMAQMVKVLVILGALSRSIPRLVQSMAWEALTPGQRLWISASSWYVNLFWAGLFAAAWYLDRVAAPMTRYQLNQLPPPNVYATLRGDKKRAILILGLVVMIAFATVYVRPAPGDAAPLVTVQ